jgi:hypothetical protein
MNNYQYDDLTTMYLDEGDWIHLAHQGGRPTMAAVDQADEKPKNHSQLLCVPVHGLLSP